MRHSQRIAVAASILTFLASAADAQAPWAITGVSGTELEEIQKATEKYHDVRAALADGYVLPMDMCVTAEIEGAPKQLGAMGLHYVRPDLLGITGAEPRVNGVGTHVDFSRPGVLIYSPQADGTQKLVAIENLVWADAWRKAGNTAAPSFHGYEYYYMHDNPNTPVDEAHGFEPHYELHFWLYEDNPAGMFAPFNPRVTCEHYKGHGGH